MNHNLTWHNMDITKLLREKQMGQKACTIWMSGLSGAGKSTIANALEKRLYAMGKKTMILDGDNVRMGLNMFFASTFWTKLQNIFGHCCKTFLDIVACPNWTKLQCPGWLRNKPAVKPLQTLFNCYSTRYGNGSSEFSSSCACSLKY